MGSRLRGNDEGPCLGGHARLARQVRVDQAAQAPLGFSLTTLADFGIQVHERLDAERKRGRLDGVINRGTERRAHHAAAKHRRRAARAHRAQRLEEIEHARLVEAHARDDEIHRRIELLERFFHGARGEELRVIVEYAPACLDGEFRAGNQHSRFRLRHKGSGLLDRAARAAVQTCRSSSRPSIASARSLYGRRRHSSSVIARDCARSAAKSRSSSPANALSSTARFTSSLRPKERLSKLVEPTTVHSRSTMNTFAWIIAGWYS